MLVSVIVSVTIHIQDSILIWIIIRLYLGFNYSLNINSEIVNHNRLRGRTQQKLRYCKVCFINIFSQ